MAECQVSYIYPSGDEEKIKLCLSPKRFTPYLAKAGYKQSYAFSLYLFNARLSKAFLFPLHVLEVSLRNQINSIFVSLYGDNWINEAAFRSNLTQESLSALGTAIARAKTPDTDDVVATMTFDFWSNLFRPEYDRCFWQTHMQALFPHHTITRSNFQKVIKEVNKFRNRVAHHEPIHHLDLSSIHTQILDVLKWISDETFLWVKHHSTFNTIIRTSPSANGESKPHFKDRCDKGFTIESETTRLDKISNQRFILCKNINDKLTSVIEGQHLASFLLSKLEQDSKSLMIDLSEFQFVDLINHLGIDNNFVSCAASESLSKAKSIFKTKGNDYIVIQNMQDIIGVIAKSHRQY